MAKLNLFIEDIYFNISSEEKEDTITAHFDDIKDMVIHLAQHFPSAMITIESVQVTASVSMTDTDDCILRLT